MADKAGLPDFGRFMRWIAAGTRHPSRLPVDGENFARVIAGARECRDATLSLRASGATIEPLVLLAAASTEEGERPPELTTARGFRVTLAYDEGATPADSTIAVLIQCPIDMIEAVRGQRAYVWYGSERFALGEFDADGKALGVLPAGVEISLNDFTQGRVKLEEPKPPPKD